MLCGKRQAINEFKTKVEEQFNIKELGQLKNTFSSSIHGNLDREEKHMLRP